MSTTLASLFGLRIPRSLAFPPLIHDGNLFALFVEEAYEGRGIGRAFFKRAVEVLNDAGCPRRWWLTTWPGTRAERFYRRAGWRPTGIKDGNLVFEKATGDQLGRAWNRLSTIERAGSSQRRLWPWAPAQRPRRAHSAGPKQRDPVRASND